MTEMKRPPFLNSLIDSWQLSLSLSRPYDLIPYWILTSIGLGGWLAVSLPAKFWDGTQLGTTASVLTGVLTFNGIILALCWSAFGKVYEIVGAGAFCAHLRKHNLLNHYLHFVGWCHGAQVVAICASGFALFAFWLPVEIWVTKASVGMAVASSFYALIQGVATSTTMQDLIWRKSAFDEHEKKLPMQAVAT